MNTSIIILNYNTSALCLQCVESIRSHIPGNTYELIIVDNHSNPEETDFLRRNVQDKDISVIYNRCNYGFGLGNMLGANIAKGKYLCFVNSDVVFTEDCITPLCEYLGTHPDTGAVTPQSYDGESRAMFSFNHFPGIRHELFGNSFLEKINPGKYPKRKGVLYTHPVAAHQIQGSLFVIPAEIFFSIGGFDPNIFLYYEECDLAMKLAARNLKRVVLPMYRFTHLQGQSTKRVKSLARRELYISKLYIYKKYKPAYLYLLYKYLNILKLIFKPYKWYILKVVWRGESLSHSLRHRQ